MTECHLPGDLFLLEEPPADLLAFRIIYVFWNRMNSTPVRYEEGFAKRGDLGKHIRALKEKDSIL